MSSNISENRSRYLNTLGEYWLQEVISDLDKETETATGTAHMALRPSGASDLGLSTVAAENLDLSTADNLAHHMAQLHGAAGRGDVSAVTPSVSSVSPPAVVGDSRHVT